MSCRSLSLGTGPTRAQAVPGIGFPCLQRGSFLVRNPSCLLTVSLLSFSQELYLNFGSKEPLCPHILRPQRGSWGYWLLRPLVVSPCPPFKFSLSSSHFIRYGQQNSKNAPARPGTVLQAVGLLAGCRREGSLPFSL